MADIVTPEKRSQMMSGIKGKNTKPELAIRLALHRSGLRYRLHDRKLPGKPDMVFPKYKAVLFVHGCFWHGHDCHLFKWPSSREDFWKTKINRNQEVDHLNKEKLLREGWRVGTIWECAIRGKARQPFENVIHSSIQWLQSDEAIFEIRGNS